MRKILRPVARVARELRGQARGIAGYVAGVPVDGLVRVSYGQRVPRADEPAVGGIVKLQSLSQLFPQTPREFNVLYLVSSRLPDAPVALADWARRKGARVVLNQNGVAYPAWYGPGWERENAPFVSLLGCADHVFYQSEFCKVSADRFAAPAAGAHEVLHNAVDTNRFTPGPKPSGRPLTLLLAGSQDQWYRVESAIRALSLLVAGGLDAELIISGRLRWSTTAASPRAQADALVSSLGLGPRVEFTGIYTQEQAPALYRRADLIVHTKYNDPCPSVVLEAMASGRPVVYSASGGVPELVGDEGGVGVAVERTWDYDVPVPPVSLAEAVHVVTGALERFAGAARQRAVARFALPDWLRRHQDVFALLVAS